jgi:hypothetical protein
VTLFGLEDRDGELAYATSVVKPGPILVDFTLNQGMILVKMEFGR